MYSQNQDEMFLSRNPGLLRGPFGVPVLSSATSVGYQVQIAESEANTDRMQVKALLLAKYGLLKLRKGHAQPAI